METPEEILGNIFDGFSAQTLVEKPCVITNVINQYTVDITYYNNNEPNILYTVPVKHLQTNSAYIFLGLKAGAYLQPLTHKFYNFIFHETDPVPQPFVDEEPEVYEEE